LAKVNFDDFEQCLNSEEQLVSELKKQMKSQALPMRKSIVLSCLIDGSVRSLIHAGGSFSHVSGAALLVGSSTGTKYFSWMVVHGLSYLTFYLVSSLY
jgi:hypothetical protein